MNELTSIIISLVGGLAILIALPAGLGIAMHAYTRFPRVAMPALAAALALVPPLGLILNGRNLSIKNLSFDGQIDPSGLAAWIFRLTSASVIAIAVTATLVYLMKRTKHDPAGRILLVGFITFFVTNVLLNGLFGSVPSLVTAHVYAMLVIGALYVNRIYGIADVLWALKWGVFLLMAGSLAYMVVSPQVVMQTNTTEIRLPFVNFRFWGLGDGPNSIGPMGLMLFLITIYQPFKRTILTLASMAAGLTVMVLAQSMTTWIAAAVIVPPYLLIRFLSHPTKGQGRSLSPFASISLISLGGAVILGAGAILLDLNALQATLGEFVGLARGQESAALSGRAGIWKVAVRVFLENPLFGYGPTAWDLDFRAKINMFFAFHAHNLFFQSLSVAGLFGVAGLIFYVATMGWQAWKLTWYTRGLAPALFAMFMFRSISEVPLELSSILTGTFLMHLTLFHVLCAGAWELAQPKPVPETTAGNPKTPRTIIPDPVRRPSAPALGRAPTGRARGSAELPPGLGVQASNDLPRRTAPTLAMRKPMHTESKGQPEKAAKSAPDRPANEPDQLGRIEPRFDL